MCGPMCHHEELDISIVLEMEKIGHRPMRTVILIKLNQMLREKRKIQLATWNEVYLRERVAADMMAQW